MTDDILKELALYELVARFDGDDLVVTEAGVRRNREVVQALIDEVKRLRSENAELKRIAHFTESDLAAKNAELQRHRNGDEVSRLKRGVYMLKDWFDRAMLMVDINSLTDDLLDRYEHLNQESTAAMTGEPKFWFAATEPSAARPDDAPTGGDGAAERPAYLNDQHHTEGD